jgi:hypothetical protein
MEFQLVVAIFYIWTAAFRVLASRLDAPAGDQTSKQTCSLKAESELGLSNYSLFPRLSFRRLSILQVMPLVFALSCGAHVIAQGPGTGVIAPPGDEPYQDLYGAHIQRTMTLLQTSNAQHRWPVKVLMYGQSIVGSDVFTADIKKYLQDKYPYADITVENRAIGGFQADRLVKTSTSDLYPYYPDLLIFHDYDGSSRDETGKSGDIERMISNVRRYTTADIILFNDHLTMNEPLSEISGNYWRYLASKYDCELVDVTREWPRYVKEHNLEPKVLLRDKVHPNENGLALLTALIARHMRFNPIFSDPWGNEVRTYEAKRSMDEAVNDEIVTTGDGWQLGTDGIIGNKKTDKLRLEFEGNRVDLVAAHTTPALAGGTAHIFVDGKSPSSFSAAYVTTRPSAGPGIWWPLLRRVILGKDPILEDWTATLTSVSTDGKDFKFNLVGSKTGPDGSGTSTEVFHSNSGRIMIDPSDWMIAAIMKQLKLTAPPAGGYQVHWSVVPEFIDQYHAPKTDEVGKIYQTMLIQGISNGHHVLEIIPNGDGPVPIASVIAYRPPLR